MGYPITLLENMLHQDKPIFDENYVIELPNKELVTLGALMTFWIEGHRKIQNALDIIKEEKAHGKNVKTTKSEEKLETEQNLEKLPSSDEHSTVWDRPNHKKQVGKNRKLTSSSCDS